MTASWPTKRFYSFRTLNSTVIQYLALLKSHLILTHNTIIIRKIPWRSSTRVTLWPRASRVNRTFCQPGRTRRAPNRTDPRSTSALFGVGAAHHRWPAKTWAPAAPSATTKPDLVLARLLQLLAVIRNKHQFRTRRPLLKKAGTSVWIRGDGSSRASSP